VLCLFTFVLFLRMYTVNKKTLPTIHLFITVANVGRFPKFFHCRILQEICNKAHANIFHILNVLLHYLAKLKIQTFSVTVLQLYLKYFTYLAKIF